jgi:hypothetical protein
MDVFDFTAGIREKEKKELENKTQGQLYLRLEYPPGW